MTRLPGTAGHRVGHAWERFWYSEEPTTALGLFRIGFAYCLLREVFTTLGRSIYAIEGGFHMPYTSFIGPVSEGTYWLLHQIQIPFILLFGIGLAARPSAVVLLGLQGWVFFSDRLNFRNHPYFFLLCLLVLALAPLDNALSLRRFLTRREDGTRPSLLGDRRPLAFQRLLQVQVSLVYLVAALHKMNAHYLSGAVLGRHLERDLLTRTSGATLSRLLDPASLERFAAFALSPGVLAGLSWFVVIAEVFLAFGLWHSRTRLAAILVGVLLHTGIAWIMNIRTFSLAMIASYLLFVPPVALRCWLGGRSDDPDRAGPPRRESRVSRPKVDL